MRMAGRVAAAIEILTDVFTLHRPASEALKDWGKYHRFAGSTDRHAIGTLVYDVLRRRNTAAARMGDGRPRALALGVLRDVWNIPAIAPTSGERAGYPTQKPLALLRRIVQLASNVGDVVLDPFCGSGTTLVAAQQLGRQWIGIDANPQAIDVVKKRLEIKD